MEKEHNIQKDGHYKSFPKNPLYNILYAEVKKGVLYPWLREYFRLQRLKIFLRPKYFIFYVHHTPCTNEAPKSHNIYKSEETCRLHSIQPRSSLEIDIITRKKKSLEIHLHKIPLTTSSKIPHPTILLLKNTTITPTPSPLAIIYPTPLPIHPSNRIPPPQPHLSSSLI